jgi:hypothetical protein
MGKIRGFAISTLFFLAIMFIFSQTCFSASVVDSTKCLQCHTEGNLHDHSWSINKPSDCLNCHTNTPGDTVASSQFIVCHPADDRVKQQLIDSHVSTPGANCIQCHTSPDVDDDGIPDSIDNCPSLCNSDQLDADGDGTGDVCDATPGCRGVVCGVPQPACESPCGGCGG